MLRIDNGGEYCSKELDEFCKHASIVRQNTSPCTPPKNRVLKRMKPTIMERARSMLSGAKLYRFFWVKVVGTAYYLINRSPYSDLINKTSYEL